MITRMCENCESYVSLPNNSCKNKKSNVCAHNFIPLYSKPSLYPETQNLIV